MQNIYDILTNNVNGATFVSINTSTEPKLKGGKKNAHQGRVDKVMEGANVMVFQNKTVNGYEAMVKRRLVKEGKNANSFGLSPRPWGTRIENTPFIEHKGKYYLEVIFLKTGDVTYTLDGVPANPWNDIIGLNLDSLEGDQGGLNDKVIIRTFKIESLTQITINKQTYRDLYFKMK